MEKSLSGERRKQEEFVQCKTEDEENKENNKELQLAGIEECIREASEELERGLYEVVGKRGEKAGTRIEEEEKIEDDYELVSIEMEGRTAEALLDTSEQFERRFSEGQDVPEEVVQSKAENQEQAEQNNLLQLTDIQVYMEEALLHTSERLEGRYSEEADMKDEARNKTENLQEKEHACELEEVKVEECIEEARFDTSDRPERRLHGEGWKENEVARIKTEGEEENPRDCKPDLAALEECVEEARLGTSEHSDRHLSEGTQKQEVVVRDEPQEGDEKGHETEWIILEECVEEGRFDATKGLERRHSGEREKEVEVLQCKIDAEREKVYGYKLQPAKIDEGIGGAKLYTLEKVKLWLSDDVRNQERVLGSEIQEGEKEESDSELEMSAVKRSFVEVSLDTSEDSEMELVEETEKNDVISNKIEETLTFITVNIENEMDVKMPYKLRSCVGDRIRKLVESCVTELNQKVRALEDELAEQNRVNCTLKDEIRRLYTELTKAAKKSNSLKEQITVFQEKANAEALKQKVYQNYAMDLAGKCYDVSFSAQKSMMERTRKCLDYKSMKIKYEILKSKYEAIGKSGTECDKTDLLDTDEETDELADEAMEQEMASVLQCQRELRENFKKVFEAPPMVQHFEVGRVRNAEALNKCRMEVLEDIQKSPLSRLKAMEAMLTKEKREHVSTVCHSCAELESVA
jgi:hypothetical protein